VSGPEGVAASHYWGRVNDPEDPGCPSITRAMGLDRAWVEDGHLVLVSVGAMGTYVEDTPAAPGGYRPMLGRGVFILSWVGDQLHAMGRPNLRHQDGAHRERTRLVGRHPVAFPAPPRGARRTPRDAELRSSTATRPAAVEQCRCRAVPQSTKPRPRVTSQGTRFPGTGSRTAGVLIAARVRFTHVQCRRYLYAWPDDVPVGHRARDGVAHRGVLR
ncbi:MAG: hypothetical protein AAGN82_30990, partial [Myxococcota bacterium]